MRALRILSGALLVAAGAVGVAAYCLLSLPDEIERITGTGGVTNPENVGRIAVDALFLLFPAASIYFGWILARGRSGPTAIRGPTKEEAREGR